MIGFVFWFVFLGADGDALAQFDLVRHGVVLCCVGWCAVLWLWGFCRGAFCRIANGAATNDASRGATQQQGHRCKRPVLSGAAASSSAKGRFTLLGPPGRCQFRLCAASSGGAWSRRPPGSTTRSSSRHASWQLLAAAGFAVWRTRSPPGVGGGVLVLGDLEGDGLASGLF